METPAVACCRPKVNKACSRRRRPSVCLFASRESVVRLPLQLTAIADESAVRTMSLYASLNSTRATLMLCTVGISRWTRARRSLNDSPEAYLCRGMCVTRALIIFLAAKCTCQAALRTIFWIGYNKSPRNGKGFANRGRSDWTAGHAIG